jgi:hypothetical protein
MNPMISVPRAKHLRAEARTALQGQVWLSVLVTFLATLLGGQMTLPAFPSIDIEIELPDASISLPDALYQWLTTVFENLPATVETYLRATWPILVGVAAVASALSLLHFLLGGCIRLGLARFRLSLIDGEQPTVGTLFFGFRRLFFKALALQVLRSLFIFLWSLLFIIPGLIAAYRYAMADYALCENPEMGVRDALRESSRMMKGNKWRLFCLDLSFIGWTLLSLLTCGIGLLWVSPYIEASKAAFYNDLKGEITPEEEPAEDAAAEEAPATAEETPADKENA